MRMRTPVEKMQAILLRLAMMCPEGRKCLSIPPELALKKVNSWEELNFYYDELCGRRYL